MPHTKNGDAVKIRYTGRTEDGSFLSNYYLRHDQRRQEHLASLRLDIAGSTVLEVGAGIGDHTSFFVDRGCRVVTTEARPENLEILRSRYPDLEVHHLDLDRPDAATIGGPFDIVYCYGLLYHLDKPAEALEFMARHCQKMLLLSTCVSWGDGESVNPLQEDAQDPTQSVSAQGCRPTREWVYNQLKRHFQFVYMSLTQPSHKEFPVDWSAPPPANVLTRSVFIASRQRLDNELLVEGIPAQQRR